MVAVDVGIPEVEPHIDMQFVFAYISCGRYLYRGLYGDYHYCCDLSSMILPLLVMNHIMLLVIDHIEVFNNIDTISF